jgi:dienelactone hydrolase
MDQPVIKRKDGEHLWAEIGPAPLCWHFFWRVERMRGILLSVLTFVSIGGSPVSFGKTDSKVIVYEKDHEKFEGLLVMPEKPQSRSPAILMVPNWLGLTDETKHQAERFAEAGYMVFAVDVYGQGVRPTSAAEAGKLAGRYKSDRKLLRQRLLLGLETLKKQSHVSPSQLLAFGYCFGGTGVLELARSGADLKGVVSFHGGLDSPTPSDGRSIKAAVLALHGADDPFVKPEELAAFEQEMRVNKVDWQLIKYGGAVHSFTDKAAGLDPSKGAAYDAKADQRSFEAALAFARKLLAP